MVPMDAKSFGSFQEAARHVLDFLKARLGFDLWMVTRTSDDDWVVLEANDKSYGVESGHLFRWKDSFCSRMVLGEGPYYAPFAKDVPIYNAQPIAQQVNIGAYIGVPLRDENGRLFGTLCAIDPQPIPGIDGDREMPLVELCARLLATIINIESRVSANQRTIERTEVKAELDPLTGAFTRRGFDRILILEEARCARLGSPAYLVIIDLVGLKQINEERGKIGGDLLLQQVASLVNQHLRPTDALARIDGGQFGLLLMDCNDERFGGVHRELLENFAEQDIAVTMTDAKRHPSHGLSMALASALERMQHRKHARHSGAPDS